MLSYPWGWVILFYTHIICQNRLVRQLLTVPKDEYFFEPWLKNYTAWLVYDRDGNFMYCKIFKKAKKSNGSTRAEIFRILRPFVLLVFKNSKWPTCVYLPFVPMGTGHMFMDLGLTLGPRTCSLLDVWVQNSLQPCSPAPQVARPKAKCKRSTVKLFWSLRI